MTPDLWWYGQQLPYSSNLYVRIHRVLYFLRRRDFTAKALLGDYLLHYAYLYTTHVLIAVMVVSTWYIQRKHVPLYIIRRPWFIFFFFRFGDAISPKQLNNYPGFQILSFRTEIRVNYLVSVDGDTKLPTDATQSSHRVQLFRQTMKTQISKLLLVQYFQLTYHIHGLNDKNANRKNKIRPYIFLEQLKCNGVVDDLLNRSCLCWNFIISRQNFGIMP